MPEPRSDLKKELLERLLRGRNTSAAEPRPVPARSQGVDIPMSYGQQQLWIHSQFATEVPIYNDPITIYRYGALDRDAMERAFTEIVRRHEAWRSTFGWKNGELIQAVQPAPERVRVPFLDLSAMPADTRDETARGIALEDALLPFNLETGPAYRLRLIRISQTEHRLYIALHHIIFDGLSLYRIFVSELKALYEAFSHNLPSPLAELPLQYGDYAVWQRRWVEEIAPQQLAYWRKRLAGAALRDTLPTDRPRPAVQTYRGAMVALALDPETSAAFKRISEALNVSLFMSLLATFYLMIWVHSGEEDLTIGTTSAGRRHSELEGIMGYFLETLVLRVSLAGDPSFAELVLRCKEELLGALANDGIPFSMLVKDLSVQRDASRHPFFQVMFSLEPHLAPLGPDWKFARMDIHNGSTKFDINLELDDTPHGIEGRLVYNRDLFAQSSIERMIAKWAAIVGEVAASPQRPIGELRERLAAAVPALKSETAAPAPGGAQRPGSLRSSVRRLFSR